MSFSYIHFLAGIQYTDNIPLFFSRKAEDKNSSRLLNDGNFIFHQESAWGVPTHFQNDGSILYLLTHACSPPNMESVRQWLLKVKQGNTLENHSGMFFCAIMLFQHPDWNYNNVA